MKKYVLPVAVLYLSAITAAWAISGSTLPQLTSPNDIVQVGSKGKGKSKSHKGHSHKGHSHKKYSHHHHGHHYHHGRYHYHGKYYGHRYAYRPRSIVGCIAAGPVWYCP
jgi:hypothetical protein